MMYLDCPLIDILSYKSYINATARIIQIFFDMPIAQQTASQRLQAFAFAKLLNFPLSFPDFKKNQDH